MANCTVVNCKHCGKRLLGGDKDNAEKTNGECAQCQYLESIGVKTIQQYNEWLKK